MSDHSVSRRRLIQTAAAGGLATMAGCSVLGGDGGGTAGSYTSWLASPTALPNTEHYEFAEYDVTAIGQQRSSWNGGIPVGEAVLAGIDPAEVTRLIRTVPQIYVLDGSYDTGAVESRLADDDYEQTGEHEGYAFYQTGRGDPAVAVGDLVLTSADPTYEPIERMKTAIDAKQGTVDRYGATSEHCSRVLDRLGGGVANLGVTLPPDTAAIGGMRNVRGYGANWQLNGSNSTVEFYYLFANTDDVPERGRETIAMNRAYGAQSTQTNVSGRLFRITANYRTADVTGLSSV